MQSNEVRIKSILKHQLGVREEYVWPESSLNNDLGADSLDRIEIVMEIEEEFGVEISDETWDDVETVEDALDVIETQG